MKAKDNQDTLPGKQVRLANIRTLLAFFRTAVAFWGLGLALFHFINIAPYKSFGLVSLIFGFVMMIWGGIEFILIDRFTDKAELETAPVCRDDTALKVNHEEHEVHEENIKK
ncbi:MAG: DUF202 domain-containing protein [Pseudomonadota bacterium]